MQIKVFDVVELKNNNLATILEIKDNKYFTEFVEKIEEQNNEYIYQIKYNTNYNRNNICSVLFYYTKRIFYLY